MPTITLTYGTIELVIAEDTLLHNTAPFTATNPSNDLNAVDDTVLLDVFKSQFAILADHPKSIALQRAYVTLVLFYRISQNPHMQLSFQQAKDELMGEKAEDTLLFIVAKLLRHNDTALREYFRRPHILLSSLLECKQAVTLGEGNVLALFQEARKQCAAEAKDRLSMKDFKMLYQRLDPLPPSPTSTTSAHLTPPEGKEEKEESEDNSATSGITSPMQTRAATSSSSSSSLSSLSSSRRAAPVYRSSSSSSTKRTKRKASTGCSVCQRNDRPEEILLCDRVGCTTECHYDCSDPPLSAIPEGSWFCAACKPLVKQALLEERSLIVRQGDNERKDAFEEGAGQTDELVEMTADEWRHAHEQWKRDKEALQQALADREAQLERLKAEVERYQRETRTYRANLDDERKEDPEHESHEKKQRTLRKRGRADAQVPNSVHEERKEQPTEDDGEQQGQPAERDEHEEQDGYEERTERKESPEHHTSAQEKQGKPPEQKSNKRTPAWSRHMIDQAKYSSRTVRPAPWSQSDASTNLELMQSIGITNQDVRGFVSHQGQRLGVGMTVTTAPSCARTASYCPIATVPSII